MNIADDQQSQISSSSIQKSPTHSTSNAIDRIYRRILSQSIAVVCRNIGFTAAHSTSLEALVSMLNRFLNNICQSSQELCEHTGRSMVTPSDVFVALINRGLEIHDLPDYLYQMRQLRPFTFNLKSHSPPQETPVLQISEPKPLPAHYPSFLPNFPDPHTYIRTEVKDDVESNYEKVRRLITQNRRDVENSLITYALSTCPSVSVFRELEQHLSFEITKNEQEHPKGRASPLQINNEEQQNHTNGQFHSNEPLENGEDIDKVKNLNGGSSLTNEFSCNDDQFGVKETERSYILKRIPHYCHEQQPYISALVTDDIDVEEDHNYFAKILSKEIEDLAENDEEETMDVGND